VCKEEEEEEERERECEEWSENESAKDLIGSIDVG
jgi:hypothetical protein